MVLVFMAPVLMAPLIRKYGTVRYGTVCVHHNKISIQYGTVLYGTGTVPYRKPRNPGTPRSGSYFGKGVRRGASRKWYHISLIKIPYRPWIAAERRYGGTTMFGAKRRE
jgi:hypothetical protein